MAESPRYEIECNLETLSTVKPPLSVVLHPPEYTTTAILIQSTGPSGNQTEAGHADPGKGHPEIGHPEIGPYFDVYSQRLNMDCNEGSINVSRLKDVCFRGHTPRPFGEIGDFSEDSVSENLLEDSLQEPCLEGNGQRLPDILDNLAESQGSCLACHSMEDNLQVRSDTRQITTLGEHQEKLRGYRVGGRREEEEEEEKEGYNYSMRKEEEKDYEREEEEEEDVTEEKERAKQRKESYNYSMNREEEEEEEEKEEDYEEEEEEEEDYEVEEEMKEEKERCKSPKVYKSSCMKESPNIELKFADFNINEIHFEKKEIFNEETKMKFTIHKNKDTLSPVGSQPLELSSPVGSQPLELSKEERQIMIDEMLYLRKDTIQGNRRHSWTSNLKFDTDLTDFKSLIVRKCSTGLELPPKVNLYSENILKEEETTEHVDRGSIADLAAIKKHWEDRFESVESEKVPVKKTQSVVRHWSVRLHNVPRKPGNKKEPPPTTDVVNRNLENMTEIRDDYNENESAIEREIRWAMEREEMLKQEQELRQLKREKLMELEQLQREEEEERNGGVQTQQIIKHYEKTDQEKFKPTYHEMTEADLGHEMSKKKEFEIRKDLSGNEEPKGDKMCPTPTQYRETVVQMEIRLQSERDAQYKEQLKLRNKPDDSQTEFLSKPTNENETVADDNANLPVHPAPDPDPVPKTQTATTTTYRHVGESKIAQELEEAKAREEEFRQRLKDLEKRKPVTESVGVNGNGRDRRDSIDELEGSVASLDLEHNTAIGASSESDVSPAPSTKIATLVNETPIEREIRLTREREEELRRQKGYPTSEKASTQRSIEVKTDAVRKYNTKSKPAKGDTMKKIATSRLQQEIKQERNREMSLRESGRINTTSDERVGEQMKYKEVSEGGPVKRNFVTVRKNSVTTKDESSPDSQPTDTENAAAKGGEGGGGANSQKRNVPNYVIRTPKISTIFSFREAKSNAGSMIEQELKEMKDREEELKKQREATLQNQTNNNNNNTE